MRNTIKNILKEDWEWVNDVRTPLEIGEPLSQTNPKNTFRIHLTHSHGEDGGTWSDNWVGFSVNGIDKVVRCLRILRVFNQRDYYDAIGFIIDEALNGNTDYLPDYERYKSDYDEMISDEERDSLEDFLNDELFDEGLSNRGRYARLERYWVTYFDEYGVEHKVKINHDEL